MTLTVTCVFNPAGERVLLISFDDHVVRATSESYVGLTHTAAVLAATSVLRYRDGTETQPSSANGYPTEVTL